MLSKISINLITIFFVFPLIYLIQTDSFSTQGYDNDIYNFSQT